MFGLNSAVRCRANLKKTQLSKTTRQGEVMSSFKRQVPSRMAVKSLPGIVAVLALTFLVACGSSSPHGQPPPTGGFANSNLSGTYAFSVLGSDNVSGVALAIAGTFQADGSGNIKGGTIDVVQPGVPQFLQNVGVTGTYNVGADGRPESESGKLTLATPSNGAFYFDFVLTSSNGGLITYFSTNAGDGGSGSGSFQLQTSVSNINGQSYAFNVSGASASTGAAIASVGDFTMGASGSGIASGIEDVVVSGTGSSIVPCRAVGCSMSAGFRPRFFTYPSSTFAASCFLPFAISALARNS